MRNNPRVLVVEDEHATRFMCHLALQNEGLDVVAVGTGAAALSELSDTRYSLVLLDMNLPDIDGLEIARDVRQRFDVATLIMTIRGAPDQRVAGFDTGAADYLIKPFDPRELVHRVKRVLRERDEDADWESCARWAGWQLDRHHGLLSRNGSCDVALTPGEAELLWVLMRATGRAVSREHLADTVCRGQSSNLRSVDVLVSRIRRKLAGCSGQSFELATVPGIGYRLIATADDG